MENNVELYYKKSLLQGMFLPGVSLIAVALQKYAVCLASCLFRLHIQLERILILWLFKTMQMLASGALSGLDGFFI